MKKEQSSKTKSSGDKTTQSKYRHANVYFVRALFKYIF